MKMKTYSNNKKDATFKSENTISKIYNSINEPIFCLRKRELVNWNIELRILPGWD